MIKQDKGRMLVPGETIFSVATGTIKPWMKRSRQAVNFMSNLDGFIGVHIVPDGRLLWFFESKDAAVRGRNLAVAEGIECGTNIAKFLVGADGVPECVPPEVE